MNWTIANIFVALFFACAPVVLALQVLVRKRFPTSAYISMSVITGWGLALAAQHYVRLGWQRCEHVTSSADSVLVGCFVHFATSYEALVALIAATIYSLLIWGAYGFARWLRQRVRRGATSLPNTSLERTRER
jgi:hypothetical protein